MLFQSTPLSSPSDNELLRMHVPNGTLDHTMINVEVTRTGNENALSLLRKFNRRMQGTGIVRHTHATRYRLRPPSKKVKKKQALKRIARNAVRQQLIKEGKISEKPMRAAKGEKGAVGK